MREINRWTDTKPSSGFSFTYGSGAAYDASIAGIRDARKARHETWRCLVNRQIKMIRGACLAGGHEETREIPAVAVAEAPSPLL